MYTALTSARTGFHVAWSFQSNGVSAVREPIRVVAPRSVRRRATRRPVLPVPPRIRVVFGMGAPPLCIRLDGRGLACLRDFIEVGLGETEHSCEAQIHMPSSQW